MCQLLWKSPQTAPGSPRALSAAVEWWSLVGWEAREPAASPRPCVLPLSALRTRGQLSAARSSPSPPRLAFAALRPADQTLRTRTAGPHCRCRYQLPAPWDQSSSKGRVSCFYLHTSQRSLTSGRPTLGLSLQVSCRGHQKSHPEHS